MKIQVFPVNFLEVNTYAIYDEDSHEAVLIDCGAQWLDEKERIERFLADKGLKPVRHLLTHAHFDHIFGAQFVYDKYGLQPEVSAADVVNYEMAVPFMQQVLHNSRTLDCPPYKVLSETKINVLGTEIHVLSTPGHTSGSVCYYIPEMKVLFSGDTLFAGAHGRTDFPTGSEKEMVESLANLSQLPADVLVYPGHGPSTTIGSEF